jgi:hypothetical protein
MGMRHLRSEQRLAGAVTWLPVVVGALLVAIVAIFIFEAPNEITTPNETGYLNTDMAISSSPAPTVPG